MIRRLPAFVCLLGILVACEDPGISNVARREFINPKHLLELQEASGAVLLEIHGVPWEGAAPEEIAGTLRMPEGPGRQVRFHYVPPGQGLIGAGDRLVLRFNPTTGSGGSVCAANGELSTRAPQRKGFVVSATFCRGSDWAVRATLDAGDVAANDWLAYYLRMQELLGKMFPE